MSTATVFDLIIAATCFGFAWLVWSALRPRPTDTPHRPQPTATEREIDDLELLYNLPAFVPEWEAGRRRLQDAINNDDTDRGDES
jgi:hypothetical protein